MNAVEKMIWEVNSGQSYDDYKHDDWQLIANHLTERLQDYFGIILEFDSNFDVGKGFCINFQSKHISAPSKSVSLAWKGILGANLIGKEKRLYISVTLFPYINARKVNALTGESFLELVYERGTEGIGSWVLKGWMKDEYEEYDFFNNDFT